MATNLNIKKTTWDLSPLFKNDRDPQIQNDLKNAKEESYKFITKWQNRKDYLKDPEVLGEALTEYEYWLKNFGLGGKAGYYMYLRSNQDQANPKLKAQLNKIEEIEIKILNDIEFFTHRIAKIPKESQEQFLKHPKLKEYKHFLEKLFAEAKYLLSEKEEKILNLKSKTAHTNWVNMVSEFISKEKGTVLTKQDKKVTKAFSEILSLVSDQTKKVRDSAAKTLNRIFRKHLDAAEHELNSILHNKKVNDELRNIKRPDLPRHLSDDIDTKTVDTLLDAVAKRSDLSAKYYELKARLLDVKKLKYHERNVDYGKINQAYSYEEAISLVHQTLAKLDTEFGDIFKKLVENGQIDAFPKKNKCGGGFCVDNLITQPTYILLNHTGKLTDVLALAHETGHAIQHSLMKKSQNAINFGTSKATAEVASTFMEDFVLDALIKDVDPKMQLALMMHKLNSDTSAIQRQVACYMFEQELHTSFREKGYLSHKEIGSLFQKHMSAYMGSFVEQSKGSQNWWIYWDHIRLFFYVYSYASGLLISKALQNTLKKDPAFIKEVKAFLAEGSAKTPKEIFATLGIDITDKNFWNKGLAEQERLLKETWALAEKLGRI